MGVFINLIPIHIVKNDLLTFFVNLIICKIGVLRKVGGIELSDKGLTGEMNPFEDGITFRSRQEE